MHSKVRPAAAKLDRLIDALADDLAQASDEEVLQACADLGMKPDMRGSAAFFGLKGPSISLAEFFDSEELQHFLKAAGWPALEAESTHAPSPSKEGGGKKTARAGKRRSRKPLI